MIAASSNMNSMSMMFSLFFLVKNVRVLSNFSFQSNDYIFSKIFNFFAIGLLFYISRILSFHFSEEAKEKKYSGSCKNVLKVQYACYYVHFKLLPELTACSFPRVLKYFFFAKLEGPPRT